MTYAQKIGDSVGRRLGASAAKVGGLFHIPRPGEPAQRASRRACPELVEGTFQDAQAFPARSGASFDRLRTRFGEAAWLALAVLAFGAPAMAADAFSTDWAKAARSDARLVAANQKLAGFEIRLAPGAITYWRDPGEAGVPPTFDFSRSANVARVDASFPAPKRIREPDGSEAFGYDSDVVIPLAVEPADPSKPVTLALDASYAVCEKLCLPARANLELTLPGAASPYAAKVEATLAATPRKIAPDAFGALTGDAASGWRLCAAREEGPARDLFVEPPEGWWATAAPTHSDGTRDCFAITLREKPKDAALPVPLRLTMTGGRGPVESTLYAR